MRVDVSSIKDVKGASIEVSLESGIRSVPGPHGDIRTQGPVAVDGKVTNTGEFLVFDGKASAVLRAVCDRCLADFEMSVSAPVEACFRKTSAASREAGPEEDEIYTFQGDYIDLTGPVVESLALEIPIQVVCDEDCKGLCPVCGTNLNLEQCGCKVDNIDPRLVVLADLLKGTAGDQER